VPIILGFEVALRRIGISHPFGTGRPWWRAGLEMTTALTVASLSWRFIERPILRLRDRIGARQTGAVYGTRSIG